MKATNSFAPMYYLSHCRVPVIAALCSCILLLSLPCGAQEEAQLYTAGTRYLDLHIHALDKYAQRVQRQQKQLLHRLRKKEDRLLGRLQRKDSVAYSRYKEQHPVSYDSISHLLQPDSATLAARTARKTNAAVDSLRALQGFLQSKTTAASGAAAAGPELGQYTGKLSAAQQQLNYNDYINGLISQNTSSLKGLRTAAGNIAGVTGIEKQLFYARAKMQAWKQLAEEPSRLEDKALEYLQGTEGFDAAMNRGSNSGGMQPGMSADDLEKMGYQTKRQMNALLQQKTGGNTAALQQQMGSQVSDWQQSLGTRKLTNSLDQTQQQLKEGRQSLKTLKQTQKPAFKVNPMRGLPFWQRLEKNYSFQTTRPAADGKPAMLQLAAGLAFKHTPSLSYGLGLAGAMGLGQSWSSIHLSFEGLGFRSYAQWKWQYGIGAYTGYERLYKQAAFGMGSSEQPSLQPSAHNNASWQESVLIGVTKSYKINSTWSGQVQLLYDIWWREKGVASPIIFRINNSK